MNDPFLRTLLHVEETNTLRAQIFFNESYTCGRTIRRMLNLEFHERIENASNLSRTYY